MALPLNTHWLDMNVVYAVFGITLAGWLFVKAIHNFLSSGNPFGVAVAHPSLRGFFREVNCVRCDQLYRLDPAIESGKNLFCPTCRTRLEIRQWELPSGKMQGYFAKAWRRDSHGMNRTLVTLIDGNGSKHSYLYGTLSPLDREHVDHECIRAIFDGQPGLENRKKWFARRSKQSLRRTQRSGSDGPAPNPTKVAADYRTLGLPDGSVLDLAQDAYEKLWELAGPSARARQHDLNVAINRITEHWQPFPPQVTPSHKVPPSRTAPSPRHWSRQNITAYLEGVLWTGDIESAWRGDSSKVLLKTLSGLRLSFLFVHLSADDQQYARATYPPARSEEGRGPARPNSTRPPRHWSRQNIMAYLERVLWTGDDSRVFLKTLDGERLSVLFVNLAADDQKYARATYPPARSEEGRGPARPNSTSSGSTSSGSTSSGTTSSGTTSSGTTSSGTTSSGTTSSGSTSSGSTSSGSTSSGSTSSGTTSSGSTSSGSTSSGSTSSGSTSSGWTGSGWTRGGDADPRVAESRSTGYAYSATIDSSGVHYSNASSTSVPIKSIPSEASEHYKTLKLEDKSCLAVVESQYRKLSKETHPDAKPNDAEATQKFRKITEAVEKIREYLNDVIV